MFTGLVLGMAQVTAVEPLGADTRLSFVCPLALPELTIGESIAVNGACLTVEQGHTGRSTRFTAFASAETLRRTTLANLTAGQSVNIERALAVGDRLGGHIVSGHVDAVATVERVSVVGGSRCVRVAVPVALAPELLPRGSVALDGVSLTINDCGPTFFEVNIIPETWRATTLSLWQPGRAINLETDVLGKYVRHNLRCAGLLPEAATTRPETGKAAATGLSETFLRENGFL